MKQPCGVSARTLAFWVLFFGVKLLQACACDSTSSVPSSSTGTEESTSDTTTERSDVVTNTAEESGATDGGSTAIVATDPSNTGGQGTNVTERTSGTATEDAPSGSSATFASAASSDNSSENIGDGGEMMAAECGDWACFPMPNSAANPPRPADYDTSDPEVVFDRVTGLLWQRMAATDDVKAEMASNVCDEITIAGYADWRLPRLMELVSLIDHASDAPAGTAKTTAALSDSGPHDFWSASPAGTTGLWLASPSGGYIDAPSAAANARVRCVRTHESRATGSEHYTASGADESRTVRDNWTGLVWQATATGSEHSFAEAQTYCGTSTVAGGGWRVPSARELITLPDRASEEDI